MVDFATLWKNHPTNRSVQFPCLLGSGFPTHRNQCAIRLGECMKNSGVKLSQMSGPITCGVHPKEDMHFLRAEEVARAFGRGSIPGVGGTEKLTGETAADFYGQLFGRKGLILFKDYWRRTGEGEGGGSGDHIDLWNGYRSTSGWLMEWFSWLGYYGGYDKAKQIWFWEVK